MDWHKRIRKLQESCGGGERLAQEIMDIPFSALSGTLRSVMSLNRQRIWHLTHDIREPGPLMKRAVEVMEQRVKTMRRFRKQPPKPAS